MAEKLSGDGGYVVKVYELCIVSAVNRLSVEAELQTAVSHHNLLPEDGRHSDSESLIAVTPLGTNLIHGEKMRDFTVGFLKCVEFHGKFTEGVWEIHGNFTDPQPYLFRGAMLMQTKKSVE